MTCGGWLQYWIDGVVGIRPKYEFYNNREGPDANGGFFCTSKWINYILFKELSKSLVYFTLRTSNAFGLAEIANKISKEILLASTTAIVKNSRSCILK